MFEKFLKTLKSDPQTGSRRIGGSILGRAADYANLLQEVSGLSFEKGLYRIIEENNVEEWKKKLYSAYPAYQDRSIPFAYDWLNRMYCMELDSTGISSQCLLVSHITDEVLRIPFGVAQFHNEVLLENIDDILEPKRFSEFLLQTQRSMLRLDECASLDVPLFLGGDYSVQNMKVLDVDVDWEITLQMLSRTRGLKAGTAISSVVQKN